MLETRRYYQETIKHGPLDVLLLEYKCPWQGTIHWFATRHKIVGKEQFIVLQQGTKLFGLESERLIGYRNIMQMTNNLKTLKKKKLTQGKQIECSSEYDMVGTSGRK